MKSKLLLFPAMLSLAASLFFGSPIDAMAAPQQVTTQTTAAAASTVPVVPSQVTFNNVSLTYYDNYAKQVLPIINQYRAQAGLPALVWNDAAAAAAKARAQEIAYLFDHTRPDGSDCLTALTQAGQVNPWRGENIAGGQTSPSEVMVTWMNSPGHYANIMHEKFASVGVACLYIPNTEYGYYWVQLFVGY